uniref:Uncharacterized protein n=1 Tax=Nothobranchius korthausae TaxID=1143690 RepID=A0A1A8H0Q4_9TELE
MRGAASSGGFPVFGESSSSRSWSFGSPDGSRTNWSCIKSRSSDSEAVCLSRDEGDVYSHGLRGTSCRCSHSSECTCSQRGSSCSAGAKVIAAVVGRSSGSGH